MEQRREYITSFLTEEIAKSKIWGKKWRRQNFVKAINQLGNGKIRVCKKSW